MRGGNGGLENNLKSIILIWVTNEEDLGKRTRKTGEIQVESAEFENKIDES